MRARLVVLLSVWLLSVLQVLVACTSTPEATSEPGPAAESQAAPEASAKPEPAADSQAAPEAAAKTEPAAKIEPAPERVASLPRASTLKLAEGERGIFAKSAIEVRVDKLVVVDSPCPPGAQCIWSGVKKQVHLTLTKGGQSASVVLGLKAPQAVLGENVALMAIDEESSPQKAELRELGQPVAKP